MRFAAAALIVLALLALPSSLGKSTLGADPKSCLQGSSLQPWPGQQEGRTNLCVNDAYLNGESAWKTLLANMPAPTKDAGEPTPEGWAAAREAATERQTVATQALTDLQTDSHGLPTWHELDAIRNQLDQSQARLDAQYRDPLASQYQSAASGIRAERISSLGVTMVPFVAGGVLAFALATYMMARWKKRTEYYRPYASKKSIATPETVASIIAASALGLAVVLAIVLGLLPNLDRLSTLLGGP